MVLFTRLYTWLYVAKKLNLYYMSTVYSTFCEHFYYFINIIIIIIIIIIACAFIFIFLIDGPYINKAVLLL